MDTDCVARLVGGSKAVSLEQGLWVGFRHSMCTVQFNIDLKAIYILSRRHDPRPLLAIRGRSASSRFADSEHPLAPCKKLVRMGHGLLGFVWPGSARCASGSLDADPCLSGPPLSLSAALLLKS